MTACGPGAPAAEGTVAAAPGTVAAGAGSGATADSEASAARRRPAPWRYPHGGGKPTGKAIAQAADRLAFYEYALELAQTQAG